MKRKTINVSERTHELIFAKMRELKCSTPELTLLKLCSYVSSCEVDMNTGKISPPTIYTWTNKADKPEFNYHIKDKSGEIVKIGGKTVHVVSKVPLPKYVKIVNLKQKL